MPTRGENNLKTTKRHDTIKTAYCNNHGIPLLRIPYWETNTMLETIGKKIGI